MESLGKSDGDGRCLEACEARTYRYAVYGLVVDTLFPLSSLAAMAIEGVDPTIEIRFATPDYFRGVSDGLKFDMGDWFHHSILSEGNVYMKADGIFEAVISADGRRVVCAKADGVEEKTFEAYFLNFILSTSLTLQGEEPLHATVVDLGGRAVGLLGESGAGKSTLAAFLVSQGATLITDDMLRLTFVGDGAVAHPGPLRLKLFDEAARRLLPGAVADGNWNAMSGKIMVRPHAPVAGQNLAVPLSGLFWLDEPASSSAPDAVSLRRLGGLDVARVLAASAMNIRYQAPARLARQLRFVERLARAVPVHALQYARRYPVLAQVAREILERTPP